jgi:hypothetical protein
MKTNNISKYNVIIADDVQSEIDIVKRIIENVGLSNYLNIHECLYVEQGSDDKTLNILVNKLNRVDIAIIDWLWEQEFIGQKLEAGGERATDIVRNKFPHCKIIFATKFPLDAENDRIVQKYDAIHLKKETSDAALSQGKKRLENTIKVCIKNRLFEIAVSEASKKQCLKAIQNNSIQWDTIITINKEDWTFENLFFIYKNQPQEQIYELFKKYIVRFPLIKKRGNVDRWNQDTGLYKSPIKDYYSLLYMEYYDELTGMANDAESFLNKLLTFLLIYLKNPTDNALKDLKNNLLSDAQSICDIRADVTRISDNKYIAFQCFKKKLIARLICITAYVLFKMSVVSILYLFTKSDYLQNNNVKMISNFLFIYGMCYDEQQSDIEKFIHECNKHSDISKLKTYEPAEREYNKILGTLDQTGSCSDYELAFISSYFNKIKSKVQDESNENVRQYFDENLKVLEEDNMLKHSHNC